MSEQRTASDVLVDRLIELGKDCIPDDSPFTTGLSLGDLAMERAERPALAGIPAAGGNT